MLKKFPILGTSEYIPWNIIAPHEQQALKNHGQTIQRLAERCGLDYVEALAVLEDRDFTIMNQTEARKKVLSIVNSYTNNL